MPPRYAYTDDLSFFAAGRRVLPPRVLRRATTMVFAIDAFTHGGCRRR